jgi:hypothetical protein
MAIMADGRILVEGEPAALIEKLAGRLWKKLVAPGDVASLRERLPIVSTRLVAGRTEIRVVGSERPDSLDAAEPTLEDVYFATLQQHGVNVVLD